MNKADLSIPQNNSKNFERLQVITTYISLHYHEKITLSDISKTVYITPQHLCRFFKNMTTMSIITYINHYRLRQACHLLETSNLSITTIALMCGFDNVSYFNRLFKGYFHCTPRHFRITSQNSKHL
ncbi:helix-turn-helix transcriptional regulator [Cellulosilyticum ruminicola]|uniref:helix-turn-helix transcriptional regulator n=1 Tax=Cellulosilyticum ruminicola TaxID=425254 RepID=UPI00155D8BDF|nr:AraC family transcriptional regulator [Cellulosilyticum ruminicola]